MDINERKIRILEAIIHDYIQTGDPVGSRTISKKHDLGVSSATIRNEMADLEEMGLIVQPYTSAGRIPSDKGYRLYVDSLMKRPDVAPDIEAVVESMIKDKMNRIDTLLEETAKLISIMTNYATVASAPIISQTKIKHVHIVPVDEKSVACVVVTDINTVKNYIIKTPILLDMKSCLALTEILNQDLRDATLNDLDRIQASCELENKVPKLRNVMTDITDALIRTLEEDEIPKIFTRGAVNILNFQEFSDVNKAREILELLEQKPYLRKLLSKDPASTINISIGEENKIETMKDCSVITTTYKIGDYSLGTIGIIGPTRMNYGEVVSLVEHISNQISHMLID